MNDMKTCRKCGETKPLSEFSRNARSKDGHQYNCKPCCVATTAAWRADNPERNREYQTEWQRDPARRARAQERHFLNKYGITIEQRDAMIEAQEGRCLICGAEAELHVDHDHETKEIRGMLCGSHNRGLGLFGHDPVLLLKAADYLLGVREAAKVE